MVKKSVKELETINREALKQLPDLPSDGTVDLKAYVIMDGDKATIRIDEKKIHIKGTSDLTGGVNPSPENGLNISATPVEVKIDFTEGNSLTDKDKTGGTDVR